jgi:hypothetical protein
MEQIYFNTAHSRIDEPRAEHRSTDTFLTDEVLDEIKNHSESCLLCTLEEMDEEDWD